MNIEPFEPVTKKGAAEILQISVRTIDYWIVSELMPKPVSIGRRCYWHPQVFYGWLAQRLSPAVSDERIKSSKTPCVTSIGSRQPDAIARSSKPRIAHRANRASRASTKTKIALGRQEARVQTLNKR